MKYSWYSEYIYVKKNRTVRCVLFEWKTQKRNREPVTDAENLDATANISKTPSDCKAEEKKKTVTDSITELKESSVDMGLQKFAQSHSQKLIILLISHSKLIVLPRHTKKKWVHFISWYI